MRTVKLNKKFIILLLIFLLFVFCCNVMNTTIEGAENKLKLTQEEKNTVDELCKESYVSKEEQEKCIGEERRLKLKTKILTNEANKLKDDMGVGVPKYNCPEVTSIYTLFAKAYCLADNIRNGAQNI